MSSDLTDSVVRIITPNGTTAGTGFVLTKDGLIITCSHVVQDCKAQQRGDLTPKKVSLAYRATGTTAEALVNLSMWHSCKGEDVAILHIDGALPQQVKPLSLGSSHGTIDHPFVTFGFPDANPEQGIWGDGHILGETKIQDVRVRQLSSSQVTPGFSGAPILDRLTHRVVGMVTSIIARDRYGRLAETAFITPSETLQRICPDLQLSDVCPYRSLSAFTESDEMFFFGRQRVVEKLLNSLRRERRFLAVLGPSGSGKSSLVQAGLIPQLRQIKIPGSDRWGVIVTRPTEDPFRRLVDQGLTGPSEDLMGMAQEWLKFHPEKERLLLIMDQFEEVFVTCPESLRKDFVKQILRLLESPLPVTIVITMRDDFYSSFAQQAHDLLEWLERGLVNVPLTLETDEVRVIVQEPANTVGLSFEAGLVETIVEDAKSTSPSSGEEAQFAPSTILPLLEFALTELWEGGHQRGNLTNEVYRVIGGVTGGLTRWADKTFFGLQDSLRPLARRIFTDLVHLGDESQGIPDSRWRRSLDELYRSESEHELVQKVVLLLVNARLLVTTNQQGIESRQGFVEIIHDALLREWGLLQQWLKKDRQFLIWQQEINRRTRAWIETCLDDPVKRDVGRLMRGRDLAAAVDWLGDRSIDLTQVEQDYIEASRKQEEEETQRLQMLLKETERQREIALARLLAAQAELVRNQQPDLLQCGVLLAVESMRRYPSVEADYALRQGLALLLRPVVCLTHEEPITTVVFSPDGGYLATTSGNYMNTMWAWVWEVPSGRKIACVTHQDIVDAVVFSPDGHYLITASRDYTTRIWDVISGKEVVRLNHEEAVNAIAISPDGRYLATASFGTAYIWEVISWQAMSWQEVARINCRGNKKAITFSKDGSYLAAACGNDALVLEIPGGRQLAQITHKEQVATVVFSPDGRYLATISGNTTWLWEVPNGQQVASMTHKLGVNDVAFSPDGQNVATASNDYFAVIWKVPSGQEIARMAHKYQVFTVAFSPDSRFLTTAGWDYTARVWEIPKDWEPPHDLEVARIGDRDQIRDAAFSPDGRYLATASINGTPRVWEATSSHKMDRMRHFGPVYTVAFSPDGRYLAIGFRESFIKVCEVATRQSVVTHLNYKGRYKDFVFRENGQYLVTMVSEDSNVRVYEATSGQEIAHMVHEEKVEIAVFSLDGCYLATSCGKTIWLWEILSGQMIARLSHKAKVKIVVFSPDGHYLAVAGDDATWLWKVPNKKPIARLKYKGEVQTVVFSPDGRYLSEGIVTYNRDASTIMIWETNSGQKVAYMTHEEIVKTIVYSRDGLYLAAASSGNVRVCEVMSGQEVILIVHESVVNSVVFSPDGCYLATASFGNLAQVWEIMSGREIARMPHDSVVHGVSFSPDGRYLATSTQNGDVQIWSIHTEDLIDEACIRLTRNLTLEEWHRFLGDEPYRKTCLNLP